MNLLQRIILFAGLLAIAGFCLHPPYQWEHTKYYVSRGNKAATITQDAGHHWIWSPPDGSVQEGNLAAGFTIESRDARIDWQRLSIYTGLMAAFCLFLAFVIFKGIPHNKTHEHRQD